MIYIGSDHGGFELKQVIVQHLKQQEIDVIDCGTFSADRVDYPDIARVVCEKVLEDDEQGILLCGTGIGMSMTANKFKGIRAAVCTDPYSSRMTRQHNDANVLCMGQRVVGEGLALDIVDSFLAAEFEGGRHKNRVEKIERD